MDNQQISSITALGILFLAFMIPMIMLVRKKYILLPIILTACFMTYGQSIVVAGVNMTVLRIIILISWVRIIIRKENQIGKFTNVDIAMIFWITSALVLGTINIGTFGGFINRMGFTYDVMGVYWLFRIGMPDSQSMNFVLKILAVIVIPLALFMTVEHFTMRNPFSILGGVPEIGMIRDGVVRAQGPFRHPILAGTFGATSLPLVLAYYKSNPTDKKLSFISMVSCLLIVLNTNSSGPLLALFFVFLGMIFWVFRNWIKVLLWSLVGLLIFMDLLMKAPIWYLSARLSSKVGGGGWHRAYLMDQAFKHIDEWWLYGTTYTAHWIPYQLGSNPDMVDITNAYLGQGVSGGLLTMILFILVVYLCFRTIGHALRINEASSLPQRISIWLIGVALFSHATSQLGVAYFDQIIVFWYMLIAIISGMAIYGEQLQEQS